MKRPPWLLAAEGELRKGATVRLDPAETRHASGVLRLSSGSRVGLTDGAGTHAEGTVSLPRRGPAEVVVDTVDEMPVPSPGVSLAVGLLSGPAMDLVVQKAVELGVRRLAPVCCGRSQLGRRRAAGRADHWVRLGLQALKQCRRVWAMEIAAPVSLEELVEATDVGSGVVAHRRGRPVHSLGGVVEPCLLVGPEGGFTEDEERLLDHTGWIRLWLGSHVLRAETAAIAGVAVLQSHVTHE